MPQIWPMNWLALLALFILTFAFFICFIYFNDTQVKSYSKVLMQTKAYDLNNLNWKW
nr:ATP synthase F0 subunit 8 [Ceriodaphnia dubia]